MATNDILPFAPTDTGTNLLTDAEYLADLQRSIGNQPGIARSKLVNKALRQSTLLAAALSQFMADRQSNNITDNLTATDLAGYLVTSIKTVAGVPTALAAGTADALTADFDPNITLVDGLTVVVHALAANTVAAVTFAPDGGAALPIVKGADRALVSGDIDGAGHWLILTYDATLGKWVLSNPAKGVNVQGATGGGILRADSVSNLTGTKSATTDQIADGIAKAWVNFNGTGTVSIRKSFNVSSITDIGPGQYSVVFLNSFGNTDYAPVISRGPAGTSFHNVQQITGIGIGSFSMSFYENITLTDNSIITAAVFN